MRNESNLTPFQAGRLVSAVEAIQKDVDLLRKEVHSLNIKIDNRLTPLESFKNRILGIAILIPLFISVLGIVVTVWMP